ncbi:MAG: MBL fold metallo-hydrolase [Kiritimatiellae bacterium]|nr:MBL fold metallo-hydrolase [Kiritimatiellia bacterium]
MEKLLSTRRTFIGAVACASASPSLAAWAAAAEHPLAGSKWAGWKSGEFQVHFIYTGVAESMFLIFPDSTSMLLDCGDHAAHARGKYVVPILPSMQRHAGEWIARYVRRVNPRGADVDYMLLSHFHNDHGGGSKWHAGVTTGRNPDYYLSGFAQAAETLHFKTAIDRGWPDYSTPAPYGGGEIAALVDNMKALYAHLEKRDGLKVERFRLGVDDQIVLRHAHAPGFRAFNFAVNGLICSPSTGQVTNPYEYLLAVKPGECLNENGMSAGTLFTYGGFTFYTAGDFSDVIKRADGKDRQLEDDLAAVMPKVNVAKINHHGHHSMSKALAAALDAQCYVGCIWDQLHMTDDTMENLESSLGGHMYFPGIVPTFFMKKDGIMRPWMKKTADPCWEGAHIVLSVPPGGERYTMTCISAADESMTVKAVFDFKTSR